MSGLPLEGIRILESAHQYPGPYCSLLLNGLGAEVLKLEHPSKGDPARQRPAFFQSLNCNKRSLSLDLKTLQGKVILHRLIADYDVFTEGFRPGVAKRLAMDYPTLRELNPGLIYCSITGYGQTGPASGLPGHDLNYLARSGMLNCLRDKDGDFIWPDVALGDLSAGMFAALGICAALVQRQRTGRGAYLDVAMLDSLLSLMTASLATFLETGSPRKERDPGYGIFTTSDGKDLVLGIAHEDWFWDRLAVLCGLVELKGMPALERRARKDELVAKLKQVIGQKPLAHWLAALEKADVPASTVQSMGQVLQDPQIKARGMIHETTLPGGEAMTRTGFPLKMPGGDAREASPPPEIGEHSGQVLAEMGYSPAEIAALRESGVI